jgi:putative ABC transport system permease protein
MWRTARRNLLAHKRRLFTTGLAVMLGVAFMTGTLVLADTITRTFDDLFADVYEGTDAVVRAEAAFKDPNGFADQRGRVDAALVDVVRGVPGVAAAAGDTFGYAQIVDRKGKPLGNPQMGAPTVGGNWTGVAEINPWTFSAGRPPQADDEVVIDKKSADAAGYKVGDMVPVLVKGGPTTARLSGIVKFGAADSPGGASFAIFTTATAQRLVSEPGKFDDIAVVAERGVSPAELRDRIAAVLPDGTEAVTGAAVTAENQDAMNRGLSFFNNFMLIFAVVALLVGGFIIFNTFSITVAQRTKEHALMRAIGASRRQILAAVILEALGVGIVASVIGLGIGVAVAGGLKAMLAALGFEIPAGGIVFTGNTATIAVSAGLIVTILAAISPARRAGKVPPLAAMRDVSAGGAGRVSRKRIAVGSVLLAAGVGSLLYGLLGRPDNALMLIGGGALIVFFGVSVLGETIALPLSRVIGAPLPRLRGITGQLARENAMRNPKRTAATASALMIGVGLVGFITIFAASTKASFSQTVDRVYTGDYVVTGSAAFGMGGIDPVLARKAAGLPEVSEVAFIRGAFMQIDGKPTQIIAASPSALRFFDVGQLSGSPSDLLASDAIAVHEDKAKELSLHVGDVVPVDFKDTGSKHLYVRMIYKELQPSGDWLLGTATYNANVADQFDYQVFVKKAPGASPAAALAALERVAADYPGANVFDQEGYKADQTRFVDQLLGLVYALLALAIVIALLGIGNTLALSILERTRELGVMRAVGMTRSQLRSAIRWESVVISLQGTLIGLGVGVFFGWALVRGLEDQGLVAFTVPVTRLAVIVVLAALSGVVAAVLPARRAARLNVLQAVVTE